MLILDKFKTHKSINISESDFSMINNFSNYYSLLTHIMGDYTVIKNENYYSLKVVCSTDFLLKLG